MVSGKRKLQEDSPPKQLDLIYDNFNQTVLVVYLIFLPLYVLYCKRLEHTNTNSIDLYTYPVF